MRDWLWFILFPVVYKPVNTCFARGSAKSMAVLPSVLRIVASAPFCNKAAKSDYRQSFNLPSSFLTNANIYFALVASLMERSEVPVVPSIRIGTTGYKQSYYISMAK